MDHTGLVQLEDVTFKTLGKKTVISGLLMLTIYLNEFITDDPQGLFSIIPTDIQQEAQFCVENGLNTDALEAFQLDLFLEKPFPSDGGDTFVFKIRAQVFISVP